MSDEPGALPLLSHALLETWKRRRGRTLTLAGYIATGRVQGAVARSAEAVYRKLTPAQREIARHIFVRLTELGEGAEDTRRRVAREELMTQPGERHEVEAVLEILSNADDRQERVRLITMDEDEVEVTHEALIRQWTRLRDDWLGQNRENLLIHRRLTRAALDWDNEDRNADYLYQEARLTQADRWAQVHGDDLNELERQFLEESRAAVQRSRRNRRLAGTAIVGLVIAVLASITIFQSRLIIQEQEYSALALARQLAAQAQLGYEEEPLLGLRLALEARELFSQEAEDIPDDVTDQIDTYVDNGRIAVLGRNVQRFQDISDTPWLLVDSGADESDELRHKADGALVEPPLAGAVEDIEPVSEESPFLLVDYAGDTPDELRHKADGTLVEPRLTGAVRNIYPVSEESPLLRGGL